MQVDPVALPLDLIDLAPAVVLSASFEGMQSASLGDVLELGEHLSYCLGLTSRL
jgi:hypothetical protein